MNARIEELKKIARRRKLDAVLVFNEANLKALTGITCDNACLLLTLGKRDTIVLYTDFRYVPMVHRVSPQLTVRNIAKLAFAGRRIGYEATMSHSRYLRLAKFAPRSTFVDLASAIADLRAVKTDDELRRLREAETLNCRIWDEAKAEFRAGMTERDMARVIQRKMIDLGDGEAFATIVCVGRNAAECHHEPDDTVWDGREGVLVDMGVKLNGVCSDLTRNLKPKRQSATYRRVYELVREANAKAIAAARPGMTAAELDAVARRHIAKGGFGKAFGHSLGHGVGYCVHEAPTVSTRNRKTVLKPGMVITIEPGVYLEGNLGVRIEDMVVITQTGCELLSHTK